MGYSDIFPWEEFYERFTKNWEEFTFIYKNNMKIKISYVSPKTTALAYGNDEIGYIPKDYNSPFEFLSDPFFDGKTLQEIWEELC